MMDVAEANDIGMIAIRPFGGIQETPPELIERCAEHIEWNDREMVDALKRQARGEDTARWEVLDFPGFDENGPIDDEACRHRAPRRVRAPARAHAAGQGAGLFAWAPTISSRISSRRATTSLIVLHDIHLDRVTDVAARFPGRARDDGRYYARDFDLAKSESLRAHERTDDEGRPVFPGRFPSAGEDFRVHSLERELAFVARPQCRHGARRVGIYPEIKIRPGTSRKGVDISLLVLDVLARFGYEEHAAPVYLQCFDETEVRRIRHELGCRLKLVQLIGEDDWHAERRI